jgi:hypothetical protein
MLWSNTITSQLFAVILLLASFGVSGAVLNEYEQTAGETIQNYQPLFNVTSNDRYLVLVLARLGLANRLRAIADWHQIAVTSNRILHVSWHATNDCNAKFTDLFEGVPETVKFSPPLLVPFDKEKFKIFIENTAKRENLTHLHLNRSNMFADQNYFMLSRDHFMSDVQILSTFYDGVVTFDQMKCQQYLALRSNFLRSLVPIKSARDIVSEIKNEHFRDKLIIGVHYRSHDAVFDWEVVPPMSEGASATKFGVGATINDFARVMTGIKTAFTITHNNISTTSVRFFVASNSPEAKDQLLARFSEIISISGGEYNRNSRGGMLLALVEWLLLSESHLVLNTHGSTFAVEAAQVHQIPLVSVYQGNLLYLNDATRPRCSHLFYLKESSNPNLMTYIEGTADKRGIVAQTINMERSNCLKEWGIDTVYHSD